MNTTSTTNTTNTTDCKRFYFISLAVLAVLSAYPLINGVRMAIISAINGALEPEQYAKYVVPYAAICVSLLLFAAMQPLFLKLKRMAFPAGLAAAYGVFFAVELFFETMQIHVSGMTLIDAPTLLTGAAATNATVDIWQAALCVLSPVMMEQSLTYASQDSFFYVIGNTAYKIHYYLISLILITMVCGLIYSMTRMLRNNDDSQKKPVYLRGLSTAALVALCIFANTTAFFRQAAPIQTPLASILTGLFFFVLGAASGVFAGSCFFGKGSRFGIGIPVLTSLCVTVSMYAGEALMMGGSLYRFGTGWFFRGLPGIVLAPIDILIVLLSGGLAWLTLSAARKHEHKPGKRTVLAAVGVCVVIALTGPVIAMTAPKYSDDDIFGCYEFYRTIYENPLSSFMAFGKLPYVYGLDEASFVIAGMGSSGIRSYTVEYCKTPVSADEFSSKDGLSSSLIFFPPDMTGYKERYLLAVMSDENGPIYGLYRMDGELWLTELRGGMLWSIYQLVKTDAATLADLARVKQYYEDNPPIEDPRGLGFYENQMTEKDVFALARKGDSLTLDDFEPFFYWLTGADFTERLYEVVGADNVFVTVKDDKLDTALLWSRRTLDISQVIDLREGFEAVTEYMNPLGTFRDITVEDAFGGQDVRDLIYENEYDQCRYYLNTKRADRIYVVFDNGEQMPLKQALEDRRISIEEAVANGLYNVFTTPIDNPLGGEFVILHHAYTFSLNGEAFYPSHTFMYVVRGDGFTVYYDIDELTQFFEWYGYEAEAMKLREALDQAEIISIARGNYVSDTTLRAAGVASDVNLMLSSHTPVSFRLR